MRKTSNLGIWTHFGEVMCDARPWLVARWKAHDRLSIRLNWTLFAVFTVPELWGEMCTARLFWQGSTSLRSIFTWIGPSSISHCLRQKTRDIGVPDGRGDGEDRIPLHSLVLTQYRSMTDRQTGRQADGRTDEFTVARTAPAKLVCGAL